MLFHLGKTLSVVKIKPRLSENLGGKNKVLQGFQSALN
jgi:hypothetical protein